jgi:hypothetical protein
VPIVENDLKFYLSGGAANADPALALGGAISSVEVDVSTLFDSVSAVEATAGDVEYRGIYVKNTHATLALSNTVVWVDSLTSSATTEIAVAVADEAKNTTIETIANEGTAPSGPVFSSPTSKATGLSLGGLSAGDYRGFWVRWTVDAGTAATTDTASIRVDGDTPA